MDLKWAVPEYKDNLIPMMGGLHIAIDYLKCIDDHMKVLGLHEIQIESDLLSPVAARKNYSRGMKAHKLTSQDLWSCICLQLMHFI